MKIAGIQAPAQKTNSTVRVHINKPVFKQEPGII